MQKTLFSLAALSLCLSSTGLRAQEEPIEAAPSPGQIVAQAGPEEWVAIAADDLLVMDLAPDAESNERRVIIQLMPPPFSQGWIRNIRKLAAARWWDGTSVNRVQDNYVVQWGDADYDNPESEGAAKSLPDDLSTVSEESYTTDYVSIHASATGVAATNPAAKWAATASDTSSTQPDVANRKWNKRDAYAEWVQLYKGWPFAAGGNVDNPKFWPAHCYGMVGVGRNLSPDTGTGAELYTVIGHAPRHLDRNIALVGRIIEGMEHLSSLPRGKGQLGFYEDPAKRVPIVSVRLGSDLPKADQPQFEYLDTEGETFARYAEARANRRDPFFNVPAGGADICNIPVPVRRVAE
ncbi:peptidylprolyl isomerase [Alterisphingorhabdus coralli]|uniref:Peptidylprolyl isomerase n=1 Tax=Alterisphingorhabdus coralli TaxID=3071408 RepID=A0AA97F9H4_9SPHN|nr:peptidylprolyl isomerase [Parasphingorhabdus sp. SCSIO 66989]WOE75507.1 peptidylprolyl isomerase [Parasphingorhabdus sp. SCSIO 66989]